jgi:hypothetical protein
MQLLKLAGFLTQWVKASAIPDRLQIAYLRALYGLHGNFNCGR